jgi:thymidine phosphorylase
VPLITASIMSKKIAEGIGGLVLDVKAGRGAFMKSEADARRLAASLVATGTRAGVRTEALITAMDAPLGAAVGNAVEVVEAIETLKGRGPADITELSVRLAASLLVLSGVEATPEAADRRVRGALASGAGVETFARIIENQGGDPRVVDDYGRLPRAPARHVVTAPRDGYLTDLDAELVGRASVSLGAGRDRVDEPVDPGVGILVKAKPGDAVRAGDAILELWYRDRAKLDAARALASSAIAIGDSRPAARPLVVGEVR